MKHTAVAHGLTCEKQLTMPLILISIIQVAEDTCNVHNNKCAIEIKSQEKFSNCTCLGGQEFAKYQTIALAKNETGTFVKEFSYYPQDKQSNK
jgi:hypothetical protein